MAGKVKKLWGRDSRDRRQVGESDESRGEDEFHVDTLDLYFDRQRAAFLKRAAEELGLKEDILRKDLGRVFLKLEELRDEQIRKTLEAAPQEAQMSEEDRNEAMALLRDPKLLDRKRNGLLRLSFSNVGVFGVPSRLIERVQMLPPGSVEQVQALKVIATMSHNIDLIHEVASAIICRTDPIHLMVCTEWEVHPLTAHAVYHRDLAEFSADLFRIVQLHEQGGLYLQTPEQTQKYSEPRRISKDYGYLRNPASRAQLATRIESYAKAAGCRETLPDQYIKEALLTSPRTDVRQLLRSLYIAADQGACEYLEHQFLDLATLFPASSSGYVQ